ncbi:MAG: ATPase, T2SS/T4P/T4SS family [Patescibacteria group bacterium]|nr:ATPase, T2SS/T4P/T4SS family [Patescibacteria group bacterium]
MKTAIHLLLGKIIGMASKRQASDIHLLAGGLPVLRMDSGLIELTDAEVLTKDFLEELKGELLDAAQQEALERHRLVRFVFLFEGKLRLRVTAYYQRGGLAFTLRLVPTTVPNLQQLGLPQAIARLVEIRRGLVIVSGPYNSGRSTTAAAIVQQVNETRSENILTIEQPVEYLITSAKSIVVQREVGRDVPSFLQALEECNQEDVTVILVGENDEPGTLRAAIELAAFGRLVYVVMNAVSAVQAIERMIAVYPSENRGLAQEQLAECLEAVVCQRLLPRISGGRVAALEVLTATPATRSLFRDGRMAQLQSVLQTSQQEGMVSLDQSLSALVKAGTISGAAALAEAIDPENLRMMIRGYG